jgi:hypothetical protein
MFENPDPNSFQSGIALVSGWKCTAGTVTFQFDDRVTFEASYGTARGDTQAVCGDTNNGFGLLVNWNLLGNRTHTVRALADGVQFASATFTVTTLGEQFLQGVSASCTVSNFPQVGKTTTLEWQESGQNFVIKGVEEGGNPLPPPPPPPQ